MTRPEVLKTIPLTYATYWNLDIDLNEDILNDGETLQHLNSLSIDWIYSTANLGLFVHPITN
ncbi:hypothetical protein DSUL_100016 [Desulfovibrionales bacterium]